MLKIIKPARIIKLDDAVSIPDVNFEFEVFDEEETPEIKEEKRKEKEKKILVDEITSEVTKKIQKEQDVILQNRLDELEKEYEEKLKNAENISKSMIDEATEKSQNMIQEAEGRVAEIEQKAYNEGLTKGVTEKSEALDKLSKEIEAVLARLVNDEDEYFVEYAGQLQNLAVESASKIICQKIEDDDMIMLDVIKSAVRTVRDASWITVEVSSKIATTLDSLEDELKASGYNVEFLTNDEAEKDTCIINTSEGIVIATLSKQMENLRQFIEDSDRDDDNED